MRNNTTDLEGQFHNSFENVYTYNNIGAWPSGKLAFSPLTVEFEGGVKVCIAEADVEGYPGMFLRANGNKLEGVWAPYPRTERQGGHNNLQMTVTEREQYIAKRNGRGSFPWRIAVVSTDDAQMADNDLVWLLASPSRIKNTDWIKPGKVAWEWWNDWGITGVDFRAGVNDETYKYYIDFASERNAGVILWAGYWAFARDIDGVCAHYAKMGVRGFKIDFMDRDDQKMVDFHYLAAATAARRSGQTWYVGGLTDWAERTIDLDLGFIGDGRYELFTDGANAARIGEDYRVERGDLPRTMTLTMSPGGGFAMMIIK